MTILSVDDVVAAMPGQLKNFFKSGQPGLATGAFTSSWLTGGFPAAGAIPASGAGASPTDATDGAIPFTNPGGGDYTYLGRMILTRQQPGIAWLVDRLVHTSGLDASSVALQTVNSTGLPARDMNGATDGEGVELWVEVYTQIGTTARTLTITYTNSDGTGSRTATVALGGSGTTFGPGRIVPVPLQAGDKGVRSVQSVQLNLSTGAAGNFGVTLLRRIAEQPSSVNGAAPVLDVFACGMPRIFDDSCLAVVFSNGTTTADTILGQLQLIQG